MLQLDNDKKLKGVKVCLEAAREKEKQTCGSESRNFNCRCYKGRELPDMMEKRKVTILCVQETM